MQRLGYLTLEPHIYYEQLGAISFDKREDRPNPTSKEFAEAEEKGFVLRKEDDHWEIERKLSSPIFVLKTDDVEKIEEKLANDRDLKPLNSDTIKAIENIIGLLSQGIAVQTSVGGVKHADTRLVLRSFDRSMKAVATEQPEFEQFETESAFAIVPNDERRPILRMMWPDKSTALERPLQTVHYSGKTYEITDPVLSPLDPAAHWNREVFRLLVALNSQVTVDISKFQQQVLRVLPTQ
jgi:hypothetical protein